MDRSGQELAPQWLKSSSNNSTWSAASHRHGPSLPQSEKEKDAYTNFRRNASRNKSYVSSFRSQGTSDKRTYTNDVNEKRMFALGDCKQNKHADSLDSMFPFRSEKDISKQSHPVILHTSGETWRRKVPSDLNSNDKSNNRKDDNKVSGGTANTVNKTSSEHEFPSLVSENEQFGCERGRWLSSGLSISQTFPFGNLAISGNNSLASTLVKAPVTVGSSSMAAVLALSSSSTWSVPTANGRNMAETLAQVPTHLHAPPRLTVETQKLEELAIKQSRQLVPLTPSALRSPVVSPTEKSKLKIGQQQQPFLCAANHSPHGGLVKLDSPKTSLVNLSALGASKEFGGFSSSAKATLIANKGTVMNSTNCSASSSPGPVTSKKPNKLESTAQMPLERRLTSQAQSRNAFFKNLSRKSSATSASLNLPLACTNTSPAELGNGQTPQIVTSGTPNSVHVPSQYVSVLSSTNENSSVITYQEKESYADEKAKKMSSANSVLYPDEEEAAFLRSLGWEENTEDDGGLTEEEINEFWDKVTSLLKGLKQEEIIAYCNKHLHMKLKPLSEILDKLFPSVMLVQLNSNDRSRNGASPPLSSSA